MNTSGHLLNNGGIRGHSAGDIFPWRVMAQGLPNRPTWWLINPQGEKVGGFSELADAMSLGRSFKDRVDSTYLVKLTMRMGEIEKWSTHLITAENAKAAELKALRNESHYEDAGFDEGDNEWYDDYMQYRIGGTTLLTDAQADTLRGLL